MSFTIQKYKKYLYRERWKIFFFKKSEESVLHGKKMFGNKHRCRCLFSPCERTYFVFLRHESRLPLLHRFPRHERAGAEPHLHAPTVHGGRREFRVQREVLPHCEKRPGGDAQPHPCQESRRSIGNASRMVRRRQQVPWWTAAIEQLQHRGQHQP